MRPITPQDYDKQYGELLEVLTGREETVLSRAHFNTFLQGLGSHHQVWVGEDDGRVIATMTCLIEPKLLHGGSNVLHIEDVIVHPDFQKRGLGRRMMEKAAQVAKAHGCYKVILDCTPENKSFYEACGFSSKQVQMSLYF